MRRDFMGLSVVGHSSCRQASAMKQMQQPHPSGLPPAANSKLGIAAGPQSRQNFMLRQIIIVDVTARALAGFSRHPCEGAVGKLII
jgi:hypothetical protein